MAGEFWENADNITRARERFQFGERGGVENGELALPCADGHLVLCIGSDEGGLLRVREVHHGSVPIAGVELVRRAPGCSSHEGVVVHFLQYGDDGGRIGQGLEPFAGSVFDVDVPIVGGQGHGPVAKHLERRDAGVDDAAAFAGGTVLCVFFSPPLSREVNQPEITLWVKGCVVDRVHRGNVPRNGLRGDLNHINTVLMRDRHLLLGWVDATVVGFHAKLDRPNGRQARSGHDVLAHVPRGGTGH